MRFNYIQDAHYECFMRLRSLRFPAQLHAPLLALVTVLLALSVITGILTYRSGAATTLERAAQRRFNASRDIVARDRLTRVHVEKLLALDSRLRAIRKSGWRLSERFAAIANHMPRRTWLVSISHATSGFALDGRTKGIMGVAETLSSFLSSRDLRPTQLVRASVLDDPRAPGVLSFELHMGSVH